MTEISGQTIKIDYSTLNGTALAGRDYTATNGTLVFAPGQTNLSVVVAVLDSAVQGTRYFSVILINAVNVDIGDGEGVGSIIGNAPPELRISDVRVKEGNAGLSNALFPVTLSRASGQSVTVDYYTTNGTAIAGTDYQETHGTLTFNAGVTNGSILVPVQGNTLNEPDKTFKVQLVAATNADIAIGQATGTIENDDLEPTLLLAPATITEGNYGITNMVFRVLLSAPSGQEVTVNYTTQDGTAMGGSDYLPTNGVLTLPAGQTRASITVAINGDLVPEPDKIFYVELTKPVHAQIVAGQGRATGTIRDDDIMPSFSISDGSVKEPVSGTTNVSLVVRLSSVSTETVTVEYGTTNGTASAGKDYTGQTGVLTFLPGATTTNLVIQVLADGKADGDKAFSVVLRNPTKANLDDDEGQITILQSYVIPPMTVVLTAPLNRTVYSYDVNTGIEPHITANVNAPGRNIWKVDYYRGSVFVASSEYGPNYTVLWSGVVPVGNYSLTAKAIDTQGNVAVSAPVVISISDTWRNVAIVQSSVDPELATLQQYLYEMGVSSTVLNKGTLTEESLKPYDLVVWHGGTGTGSEITAQDVARVQELLENETPVYFLGDTLLASANKLNDTLRTSWNNVLHLKSTGVPMTAGKVALETNATAIVSARYGVATGFNYSGTMENAKADSNAEVIARSGTSELMVAYPKSNGEGAKSITQDFRASDVLASWEKKILFQNAVNWLIDGPSCGLSSFDIQMEGPKGAIEADQKIVYTIRASQKGDCTATGVVLTNYLPSSVAFYSAETYTGSYSYSDGKVLFDLGLLNNDDTVEMKITVIPKEAGEITNIASIRGNGSVFDANNWVTNKVMVGGSLKPVLSVDRAVPGKPELRISGKAGQPYQIQESKDLSSWLEITNTIHDGWYMPLPVSQPAKGTYRFYRAVTQ